MSRRRGAAAAAGAGPKAKAAGTAGAGAAEAGAAEATGGSTSWRVWLAGSIPAGSGTSIDRRSSFVNLFVRELWSSVTPTTHPLTPTGPTSPKPTPEPKK